MSKVSRIVAEGDRVRVGGAEAVVWDIPAHTAGHVAYYFEDEGMIFVGDTMFAMGCGRLFEGTPQQMYANLQRIAALPGDVRIYCGHEYTLANAHLRVHAEPDNAAAADRFERGSGASRCGPDHLADDCRTGTRNQSFRSCIELSRSSLVCGRKKTASVKPDERHMNERRKAPEGGCNG